MPDANLLQRLKSNSDGLKDLLLFGRVRCMIKNCTLVGSVKTSCDGAFAIVDVFAIKCLGIDYFAERGTMTRDQIYNTKGSVVIYLNKPNLVGKYVKVSGRSANKGATVKQNRKHTRPSDGVVAFVWSKVNDSWVIEPNAISELAVDDPNITSTPFLEYVIKYIGQNTEIEEYPVSNILEFEGVHDYEELDTCEMENIKSGIHHSNERLDLSKIDLKLTFHDKGVGLPEYYYDVKDEIDEQAKKRLDYAKGIITDIKKKTNDNCEVVYSAARHIKTSFIENIACRFAERVGTSSVKGRVYLEEFLNSLSLVHSEDEDKPFSEKNVQLIREQIFNNPYSMSDNSVLLLNDITFASIVIGIGAGIGYSSLEGNRRSIERVGSITLDEWFYTLLSNPYMLGLMGSGLDVVDCDVIYFSFSRYFAPSIVDSGSVAEFRNMLLYLNAINDLSKEDSLVPKRNVRGYAYKYKGSNFLNKSYFMAKMDIVALLEVLCRAESIKLTSSQVSMIVSETWKNNVVLNRLIDNGIVNTIEDDCIILETTLEKEFLIFSVFQEKGEKLTGITEEQCEEVCNAFEEKVGFKLEPLQRKGVALIRYDGAVLTGCAGSGKTTTSDGMVMGLEKYLKGRKLVYCAPTGKAARRMAEVLNKMVKTVHSEFKIGVGVTDGYLARVDRKKASALKVDDKSKGRVYIVDESGMLNRDLLYEIARSLKLTDIIYFLGDIKQLPPIGTGCPFYNLMSIMPCVELGVSKRAAEGSLINYNTTVINCLSDGVMEGIITDDNSFVSVDCSNEAISGNILKLWKKEESKGVSEDDIQIISAYATESKLYSSTCLNPIMQKYLRRNDDFCFRHVNKDFFKNDRVIHANVNLYGMQRFVKTGTFMYEEVVTTGVVNGEMGKIVGCYDSRNYTFTELGDADGIPNMAEEGIYKNVSEEDFDELIELRKSYEDKMIPVSELIGDNTWFVEVEVYDVNLKRNVSIFYDGRIRVKDGIVELTGGMLDNLELAYALTCHKMQGSQIPVVIAPIGSDAGVNFVNRNMLNTIITRSREEVILVGDIDSDDSAFNRGRLHTARYRNESMLTLLCEEARREEDGKR